MTPTEVAAQHTRTLADVLLGAMFGALLVGIPVYVSPFGQATTPAAGVGALLVAAIVSYVKAGNLDTRADDEAATAKRRAGA